MTPRERLDLGNAIKLGCNIALAGQILDIGRKVIETRCKLVARDGETIPESARFLADTVNVGRGQRYDVVWQARLPGKWLIHCHIGHHTTNNNVEEKGGGGLMVVIDVQP